MQIERGRFVSGNTVMVETKVLHEAENYSEIKDVSWTIAPRGPNSTSTTTAASFELARVRLRSQTSPIGPHLVVLRSVTSMRSVILHLLPVLCPIRVPKGGEGRIEGDEGVIKGQSLIPLI